MPLPALYQKSALIWFHYLLSGTGTSNGTCEFESFPDKIADLNYIHDLLDEFEINIEKKKRV